MKKLILLLPLLLLVLTGCGTKKATIPTDQTQLPIEQTNTNSNQAESTTKDLTYQNKRFGFALNLPTRWQSYKVLETKDNTGYFYTFEIKHSGSLNNGYGKPFVLGVFSPDVWKKMKNEIPRPWVYIKENDKYVFAYVTAQDDEGYIGFGEIVPGEEYHGPLYDVKTTIIPSFNFISIEESTDIKTYVNKTYKHSFDYPAEYTLRASSDRGQYLVDKASLSVVQAQPEDDKLLFEDLMFKRVKLLCDADGTTASITCPRYAVEPVAFKTDFDLPAYKLVFVEQTTTLKENSKPVITSKNKTIYVVNLGGKGKDRIMLSIAPADDDLTVANNIALSVRKNK